MVTKVLILVMQIKMGWVEKLCFTFPGFGIGLDIHKVIGKIPPPKAGFTPSKYKYMGP